VKRLVTTYSTVDWSADGLLVTKTRPKAPDARRRFRNELRVNRLLLSEHAPVSSPALVDFDIQHRRLTFEAVLGENLGPKYLTELSELEIGEMVDSPEVCNGSVPVAVGFERLTFRSAAECPAS
jgi:hypothetical protein